MSQDAPSSPELPHRPEGDAAPEGDGELSEDARTSAEERDARLLAELRSLLEPRPDGEGGTRAGDLAASLESRLEGSSLPVDQLADILLRLLASDDRSSREPAEEPVGGAEPGDGTRRIGHYRLLEPLGGGSQGEVYLAEDTRLSRKVALKVLSVPFLGAASALERFRREAAIASRLEDPGICSVYDAGRADGAYYIAMRYIEGRTLAEIIAAAQSDRRKGPRALDLPSPTEGESAGVSNGEAGDGRRSAMSSSSAREKIHQAARLAERVARSLHRAHEAGLVHRDVKPGNILVTGDGDPVILDFGLARDEASQAESLTQSQDILGTPAYMSPEQISGGAARVDARTDVYSLGVVLYECLTLERPFQGPTRDALYRMILDAPVPEPRKLNPHISKDLKVILDTAMEKDRDRRYQSALELAEDLRRVRSYEPIRARPSGALVRFLRWTQRNPLLAATAIGLFVVLTAGLVVSLLLLSEVRIETEQKEEALWDSLISQARATFRSGRSGRRFESLEAIRKAAEIRSGPDLRDAAIAALARSDLRRVDDRAAIPSDALWVGHDEAGKRRAWIDPSGKIRVLREGEGLEFTIAGPGIPESAFDAYLRLGSRGDLLAFRLGEEIQAWDLERRERLLKIARGGRARALEFSPDRRALASGQLDGRVHLHDLESGEEIRILHPAERPFNIFTLRFSPDGRYIAASSERESRVYVWDLESAGIREIRPPSCILGLHWHPRERRLATAGVDGQVCLWDIDGSGSPVVTLEDPGGLLGGALFHREGDCLVSTNFDGTLRLWNLATLRPILSVRGTRTGREPRWRRGGRRITFQGAPSHDSIWDLDPGSECREFIAASVAVDGLDVAPDGRLLVATVAANDRERVSSKVQIWDLHCGRRLAVLPAERGAAVRWLDRTLLSPASDSSLIVADGSVTGSCIWRWPVTSVSRGRLRIGPPLALRALVEYLPEISLSEGGSKMAALFSRRSLLVDSLDGEERTLTLRSGDDLGSVAIHPGARWVAAGNVNKPGVRIFDARSGGLVTHLSSAAASDVLFAPAGEWLIAASAGEYRIWKAGSWELVRRLERELPSAREAMAFRGDGKLLALAFAQDRISLVDVPSLEIAARLRAPGSPRVRFLEFSRDGRWLAAGGEGVHVWDLRRIRMGLADLGLASGFLPPGAGGPGRSRIPLDIEVKYDRERLNSEKLKALARAIESGAELSSDDAGKVRWSRIRLLESLRRFEDCIADLDWIIENGKSSSYTYERRAGCHLRLRQYAQARKDLEKALEIEPGRASAADSLTWLLAAGPAEHRDAKRALEVVRGVLEGNPSDRRSLVSLAMVSYRLERYDDVTSTLLSFDATGRPEIAGPKFLLLAMSYRRRGEAAQAREFYRRARLELSRLPDLGAYLASLQAEAEELFGGREEP